MARRGRGFGGGTGVLFGLIAFVFLFIIATVIAILMHQRANKAEQSVAEGRKTIERLARPGERTKLETDRADTPKSDSLVGRLMEDYGQLRQWVNGNREEKQATLQELVTKSVPEGFTLLGYIEKLVAEKESADQEISKAKAEAKAAADKAAALQVERDHLAEAFRKATDDLKGNYGSVEKGFKVAIDTASKNLDSAAKDFSKSMDEKEAALKQIEAQIAQKDQEIASLKASLSKAQPESTGSKSQQVDAASLPDGSVASILQEENLVYIDRGRRHRILPGMTFEVFDRATGVSVDATGLKRGKATIQVVSMSDESAVARIVRRDKDQRKSVVEGDLIANAVYDPNYKFKFMVFGEFDIDQIGQASTSDRLRIETIITEWGGTLARDLTYDVDYLVMGREPKSPDPLPPGTIDADAISKHKAAEQRYAEHQRMIDAAKQLTVPVLNQNRFLALVGYYRR